MSRWILLICLVTNNVHSQTHDAYMDNQWYKGELNCTSYSCEIYCDEYQSCYDATIYANTATELTITCSEYWSCRSMNLYANDTWTLTINCEYDGACSYMNVYAKNAGTLNFNPYTKTSGVTLFVQQASYIYINCNDTDSCGSMDIYAKNANSITVTANNDQSWYYGKLYADNANSISLTCISKKSDYACYGPAWYLPSDGMNTNIYCYGTGCQDTNNILTDNGVNSLYNLYINGCNECDNDKTSCAQFSFLCNPSGPIVGSNGYYSSFNYDGKDTFYAGSCDNDNICGCSSVESSFTWDNNRDDSNCILSDWNVAPGPSTPGPTYYGEIPTSSGRTDGFESGNNIKITPDFGYYVGGVVYLLLILGITICFAKHGYKDRKEDVINKKTWVHANNQRKQNKKNANYAYSHVSQVSTQPSAQPSAQPSTKETKWERPQVIEEKETKYDDDGGNEQEELPNGWRKAYTTDNRVYYQNDTTKETQWEKPTIDNVEMTNMNVEEGPGANPGANDIETVEPEGENRYTLQ